MKSPGVTTLVYAATPPAIPAALILAHGAGAGQRSPFMINMASAIAAHGVDVVTFDFPYMEQRRRVPDKGPALESCWKAVVDSVLAELDTARRALFIGGKSMGGRIATQMAAAHGETPLAGLVLLGYPLHPPGRPDERRDRHLPHVKRPMLFVQGERDAFGTPAELEPVVRTLAPPAMLRVIAGGDHSFKVARATKDAQAAVYDQVRATIVDWIRGTITTRPETSPRPR